MMGRESLFQLLSDADDKINECSQTDEDAHGGVHTVAGQSLLKKRTDRNRRKVVNSSRALYSRDPERFTYFHFDHFDQKRASSITRDLAKRPENLARLRSFRSQNDRNRLSKGRAECRFRNI